MARLSSQQVVAALVQRGVPQHVAEGVALNFADESGLNTGIQEKAPTSGRGGFGIAQWTGPRRVALESYAGSKGKSPDDPDTQFDFFMLENAGSEKAAWQKVLASPDRNSAAISFVNDWERPRADLAAARSQRYSGQGPGEGAGHFGGTGLGTPADYGDSPSESGGARFGGTGLGDPAESKSPYSLPKSGTGDKISEALGGAFKGMGGKAATLGEGGNAPQLPAVAPAPLQSMPIVGGSGAQEQDYQAMMAALMQRLNSGKLWG